jgi:ABC-2 type transport system ATP-binding protein
MSAGEPVISLQELRKCFGRTIAVDGLSMTLGEGGIFGFLGSNGAGKTTTIRMLCGLTRPTRGTGTIYGLDIWRDRSRLRSQFGYVPQRFCLYADLTVMENTRFFGAAYRIAKSRLVTRIERLLWELDLAPNQDVKAGNLSGGFKQLLSIGCALIHEPLLLLLDEPTAGLDPIHRQRIWLLLYGLSQQGTTIVVTTHYIDEADRCTDLGLIQGGKLLTKGSPVDLKGRLSGKLLEIHVENLRETMQIIGRHPDVSGVELRGERLRIRARDPEALLDGWLRHWPYANLGWFGYTWAEPDMKDVFMAYSQGYHAEGELRSKKSGGEQRTNVAGEVLPPLRTGS